MRSPRFLARLRSTRLQAALSLGVVLAAGATGTWAYWTDSAVVSGTSISSGSIDLMVNNQQNDTGFTTMSLSGMVPGNSAAGVITVKNNGNSPLTYYVDGAASNTDGKGLGAAMTVKVTGDAARSGSTPNFTCAGSALANTGSAFAANLVQSTNPRLLAAGASETLCVQATLPTGAATSLQNATTNVSFTFNASQLIP
jgi:predicted ribosomally synthesized peptide with SipW-like signal peptide